VSGGNAEGRISSYTWGSTGGADLAEEYLVHDESINAGDVVSLTDELLYVERASVDSPHVLGIVSTKPGVTLRDWPGGISPENNRAIALAGRVPVKISKENGEVKVGDRLTLSKTLPGLAMKQTTSGQSIGIVMEESLGKDKVLTFINLSYWTPVMQLSVAQNSDGDIVDTSDQYDLNGFSFINVKAIASISGKWSIDENGNIVAVSITAEKARLNKLEMVDQGTGEIYCTWIEFGEWLKVAGECLDRDGESDNSSGEVAGESTEVTVDDNNNDDLASDSIPDATTPDSDPGEGSPESSPSESSTEIPDQVGDGTSETTPEPEPVIEEPAAEPVVEGGL
ncbi:MAG: hypothetical protein HYV13_03620, partial [Candidatus Doudnabacteria bacterium]|nr:hypothetical protein [Candidatus Doudnabacteria bacterium]